MSSATYKVVLISRVLRSWCLHANCRKLGLSTSSRATAVAERNAGGDSQQEEIVIPEYVERSATDILKALASTVGRDLTAAHYKFHDDPYLLPNSNMDKRTYSLSQEAGRTAARWVRDSQSHLFQHQTAQPFSEALAPAPLYDENSDVSEADLQRLVDQAHVSDAITVYKKLSAENKELGRETKQSLLELLCYYNCEDGLDEERLEERWFANNRQSGKPRKTWKDNGAAEEVFRSLEPLDARAYNTLIKGMCKFYQADRAMKLWAEMTNLGFATELETYESLISISSFVMQASWKDWEHVEGLLRRLCSEGLRPRADTLTAVLKALQATGGWHRAPQLALASWREFRRQGVSPTLASYYLLISICYRGRGPHSPMLFSSVMSELQGRTFHIQHPMDTSFFVTAMEICNIGLQNSELALRLDELLHTGNNYNLIGDHLKEAVYYRNLMVLLFSTEPIEEFMANYYSKLVPNIYTPEPGVMIGLVKAISLNGAVEYLPQIWADMVLFEHTNRANLLESVLQALALNPGQSDELRAQLADVGWSLYQVVEKQTRTDAVRWTAGMLGDLMMVLSHAGRVQDAATVLQKLDREQTSIVGAPDIQAVEALFNMALLHQTTPVAVFCVRYASDMGFGEAQAMCETLASTVTITEDDRAQLVAAGLSVPSS